MSLDVYLIRKKYLSYDEGKNYEEDNEEVYWANITHNLNKMADEAGIYEVLWRPEEKDYEIAEDIIKPLSVGLKLLESDPERFRKFNPENGWGNYTNLVEFVKNYLTACIEYPKAKIDISR